MPLPKHLTKNAPHKGIVTIYPQYTDLTTGQITNIRCELQGVFWNDLNKKDYQKTGVITVTDTKLIIPYLSCFTRPAHSFYSRKQSLLDVKDSACSFPHKNRSGIRSGHTVSGSALPYSLAATGREYIDAEEWAKLPYEEARDNYWTINPRQTPSTIIIQGMNEHEFIFGLENDPIQENRLSYQERLFMEQNTQAKRVILFNPQLFGSKRFWHFITKC